MGTDLFTEILDCFWNNTQCTKPAHRILLRLLYHSQQHRQCTYNVTMRRAPATIVVVEKQCVLYNVSVFVAFSVQHGMSMRHIVCHLWPTPLYSIFPHYLINGMI
jgi:hypothetical protein